VGGIVGVNYLRRLKIVPLVCVVCLLLMGCSEAKTVQKGQEASKGGYPLTIEDDLGRKVTIDAQPQRIVSLAPANTEILFALGLGDKVVGVTDYCDYPDEAKAKDKVGDFYGPSIEKIIALDPDVIFATGGIQVEAVQQLESLGQVVVAVNPGNIDEIMQAIELVGAVSERKEKADQITTDMRHRIAKVQKTLAAVPREQIPDAFVLVWIEDSRLFSAGPGTFVSSIISLAGGSNVADDTGVEYPQYSSEKLMEVNPEAIISTAHGYSNPEDVKKVLRLDNLKAVRNNQVYIVEDADLLTLPGPRIVQGLELTAHFLHPDLFPSE
jgi:iron complex transport system substrate-binding protein